MEKYTVEQLAKNDYELMDKLTEDDIVGFKASSLTKQEIKFPKASIEKISAMGITDYDHKSGINKKIIAEGDSWFDYPPGTDLIDCLKKFHDFEIENYARYGDTLENMIYGTGITNDYNRTTPSIRKILQRIGQELPKIFLFSGGGNDIAGSEFASYLNHQESGLDLIRTDYVEYVIHTVFRQYFLDLIAKVEKASNGITHIVTHGYANTAPTGKAFEFIWVNVSGPWLRPSLAQKGIFDYDRQRECVFYLINEYNKMLETLDQENPNFHFVDFRSIISPDADWVNELHLTNRGYARCANEMAKQIQEIFNKN